MTQTLQERMVELMTATGWTVGEIARIAGVTSAAVSQWVGNGQGKQSKSIGNAEAALRLEKASGFSWIWLAHGKGPKLAQEIGVPAEAKEDQPEAEQLAEAIELITKALMNTDEFTRGLVRHSLSRLGLDSPESGNISQKIAELLVKKNAPSGEGHDLPRRTGKLIAGSAIKDLGGNDGQRVRAATQGGRKG